MSTLVLSDGPRVAPAEFLARLKTFDPSLCIEYNTRRHRWVIEQCIEHFAPTAEHTHVCRRIYVWLVEDPEKNFLSLDHVDGIFEELARRDTLRAGFEPGPEGLKKFIDNAEYIRVKDQEKRDAQARELPKLARKDHFLSMNRCKLLLERHGLRLNK